MSQIKSNIFGINPPDFDRVNVNKYFHHTNYYYYIFYKNVTIFVSEDFFAEIAYYKQIREIIKRYKSEQKEESIESLLQIDHNCDFCGIDIEHGNCIYERFLRDGENKMHTFCSNKCVKKDSEAYIIENIMKLEKFKKLLTGAKNE